MIGGDEEGHPWHCDQLVELDRMMRFHRRLDRVVTLTFLAWTITAVWILLL